MCEAFSPPLILLSQGAQSIRRGKRGLYQLCRRTYYLFQSDIYSSIAIEPKETHAWSALGRLVCLFLDVPHLATYVRTLSLELGSDPERNRGPKSLKEADDQVEEALKVYHAAMTLDLTFKPTIIPLTAEYRAVFLLQLVKGIETLHFNFTGRSEDDPTVIDEFFTLATAGALRIDNPLYHKATMVPQAPEFLSKLRNITILPGNRVSRAFIVILPFLPSIRTIRFNGSAPLSEPFIWYRSNALNVEKLYKTSMLEELWIGASSSSDDPWPDLALMLQLPKHLRKLTLQCSSQLPRESDSAWEALREAFKLMGQARALEIESFSLLAPRPEYFNWQHARMWNTFLETSTGLKEIELPMWFLCSLMWEPNDVGDSSFPFRRVPLWMQLPITLESLKLTIDYTMPAPLAQGESFISALRELVSSVGRMRVPELQRITMRQWNTVSFTPDEEADCKRLLDSCNARGIQLRREFATADYHELDID
ncbi:hypothetical protein BDZ91DRAFT_798415 [Kalaharituber pfeilii]|nr:hypothetical protein BDZ91DRAFT_798415 [Kalaharituber pfeilii]